MKKGIVKKLLSGLFVGAFIVGACSFSYAAIKNLTSPDEADKVGQGSAMIVKDVYSAGTTTSHTQEVFIGDDTDSIGIAFHCPLNGVLIGTSSFGLEVSMDGTTFGSITATEMVKVTNTLYTFPGPTGGTQSAMLAGEFRGTHTAVFVGTLGTGTALTNDFYIVKPVGKILRFQSTMTTSGSDTTKYKIVIRKMQSMNKF